MTKLRLPIAITAFLLAIVPMLALSQSTPKRQEQTHFSAEDETVNHPVAIPAGVLAILARDELVHAALGDQKISPADIPPSWFSAAEIQLGNKDERDLIVAAEGPLVGGNISAF